MRCSLLTISAVLLLAMPVLAAEHQVSLPVGHTTTLSLPAPVSGVRVKDPKLVEVSTRGRRVTFVALEQGHTQAVVRTRDGELRFNIYVAQDRYALPY